MIVIVLAVVFFFANVPDIKTEDDYHLDDTAPDVSHSIWTHPHFWMAVARAVPLCRGAGRHLQLLHQLHDFGGAADSRILGSRRTSREWFENHHGVLGISNKGAANLASVGFLCFLIGRFTRRAAC